MREEITKFRKTSEEQRPDWPMLREDNASFDWASTGRVETDFGQTDFGHRYPTDFGQTDFGQTDFGQS